MLSLTRMFIRHRRQARLFLILAGVLCLMTIAFALAQAGSNRSISTKEHLSKPGWWPRKGSAARDEYVGATACARCHSSIVATQGQHSMARTLTRASDGEILHSVVGSGFRLGSLQYQITQNSDGAISATVTDGTHSSPHGISLGIWQRASRTESPVPGSFQSV